MLIDPGTMRHRVTLMRYTTAPNSVGELKRTWSAVGTYWAFVEPLSGRELTFARQVNSLVTHRVTMRVIGSLTSKDYLLYQGRILQIASITSVREYGEFYLLTCVEQTSPPPFP